MVIDITHEVCPMTFVRTKLCLEQLAAGDILTVRLSEGEALENVPRAVADHGHEILSLTAIEPRLYELIIRKR